MKIINITRRTFSGRALSLSATGLVLHSFPRALSAQERPLPFQPFAAQIARLLTALEMLGEPLPPADSAKIRGALASQNEPVALQALTTVLDRHVLMGITLNPENRVSVARGQARAQLNEGGWRSFLLRVENHSAATAPLKIKSPQGGPTGRRSSLAITGVHDFTNGAVDPAESRSRWIAVNTFDLPPMTPSLSGLPLEYRIVQIYSRDRGMREASLEADLGWGEQDLGFRSTLPVLFECLPSRTITLNIRDEHGVPATASLLLTDPLGRIYPTQTKRELPDLAFESQIYRRDGETLQLPDGAYTLDFGRGPEYLRSRKQLVIGPSTKSISLDLHRWVTPSDLGYYSGDTHIHAAGCSHYESPTEGVVPEVMLRQVEGEALDLGSVLNWGPGFEYQKQFFSGHVHSSEPLTHVHPHTQASDQPSIPPILRYDIEVSGFPSSHCGHLVLLQLKQQRFPGASTIDDWPSWNLPILRWAETQGAITGYAHSAHGLVVDSTALPNLLMPPFNSMGANEYIVDVTHEGAIDFISGCDLWPFAELNIWYHTLNCGFRTAFAGETDFPCITDERVGGGRSYVELPSRPAGDQGYSQWLQALVNRNAYFGDGRSHIMHLALEHEGRSTRDPSPSKPDLSLSQPGRVRVTAQVCAGLEPAPTTLTRAIQKASPYDKPFWHLERARIADSRRVLVELVINSIAVDRVEIEADGALHPVSFSCTVAQSSWIALRILPSSHTNPVFASVSGAPVRASRRSAAWCRQAVDVCWKEKRKRIRPAELPAAAAAYDHARRRYEAILAETKSD